MHSLCDSRRLQYFARLTAKCALCFPFLDKFLSTDVLLLEVDIAFAETKSSDISIPIKPLDVAH